MSRKNDEMNIITMQSDRNHLVIKEEHVKSKEEMENMQLSFSMFKEKADMYSSQDNSLIEDL